MDRALAAGLPREDLLRVVTARADQRDLGIPPDLTDAATARAHNHPAARALDETHRARARR